MHVTIVTEENLPKTPQAFQDYVAKYFVKKNLLGRDCFIAVRTIEISSHKKNNSGSAPSHNVDIMSFKEGLPKNVSLNNWIEKESRKLPDERLIEDTIIQFPIKADFNID